MTDIRSLERTLLDNLRWNKARIKFVARFLLALYAMQYLAPFSDQLRALRCWCLAEGYQTFVL